MIYKPSKLIYSSVHIDRVYHFIRDHFPRIPLYTYISFNGPGAIKNDIRRVSVQNDLIFVHNDQLRTVDIHMCAYRSIYQFEHMNILKSVGMVD